MCPSRNTRYGHAQQTEKYTKGGHFRPYAPLPSPNLSWQLPFLHTKNCEREREKKEKRRKKKTQSRRLKTLKVLTKIRRSDLCPNKGQIPSSWSDFITSNVDSAIFGKREKPQRDVQTRAGEDPETTLIFFLSSGRKFSVGENSKGFAMADALSVIPASVLRNLSDKLYEKRKNAALEVPFVSHFDRFSFLGFLGGFVGSWRTCVVYLSVCVCVCQVEGIVKQLAAAGDHDKITAVINLLILDFTYSAQANYRKVFQ